MKQRPRIYYSDTQKALMWERWKQGWTLHEIGKLFDRAHSSTDAAYWDQLLGVGDGSNGPH